MRARAPQQPKRRAEIEPRLREDDPLPQATQNRPHDRRTSSPEVNQSSKQVDADDTTEREGSPGLTIGGGGHA